MKRLQDVLRTLITRRLVLTFDRVDFVYPRLSRRRLRNWLLTELAWGLKSDKVWAYPTLLQIEPGNVCNLRCPVCHSVTDGKPQGFLSIEDFKKIMDEVGDEILFLHFWGWGEPFMNKDFFSMVKYAKDRGVQIISSTNGHFFESHGNIDKLIDSGLDVLIVALDGIDPETYENYRRQGDFERVLSGLKELVKKKGEKGARSPRINLRMLVTRDNEDQFDRMKALAQEVGVDIFSLKTLCSFDNEVEGAELLPCRPEFRRFSYGPDGEPIRQENTCKKFWNHPTIYRDGTVVLCDYHTGTDLSLGNVFDGSGRADFGKIWFGKEYRRMRAQFLRGDRRDMRCDSCAINYAGVDRCVSHAFEIEAGGEVRSDEMSAEPIVSIIIASYNAAATIEATLASLERQTARRQSEIIVVDSSTDGTAGFVRENFPGIRVLAFSSRKFCGDARNEGLRVARGRIVAMTDADCRAGPSWLENIIRAHEAAHPVVGGAIACGNPESYVGWGAYFCEFSRWQPSGPPRYIPDMAGANISYKREVFEAHGALIEGTYCSDTEFHWRLAKKGQKIHFDPSIVVCHQNIDRLRPFLRHELFHGRSFAVMRCRARAFSVARRAFYALLAPLIFLKLLAWNAVRGILLGAYPASYLKALPVTTLGILCWTAGEAAGYARGSN